MQNSRNLRIRTSILSPDSNRSIKQFFTPREHSTKFDFEISTINQINSDPFIKLKAGAPEKLQPVMPRNTRRCITKTANSSICIKLPEIQGNAGVKFRHEKTYFKPEKIESLPNFKRELLSPSKSSQSKQEHNSKLKIFKKPSKKVTFSEKPLDVSFGNSG